MRISDWSSDVCSSDLDYLYELAWGTFAPQLRLEYQHDLDADSVATMQYADLPLGPFYRADVDGFDRNRFEIGRGAAWQTRHRFAVRLEYLHLLGNSGEDEQSLRLQLDTRSEENTSELQSIMRNSY